MPYLTAAFVLPSLLPGDRYLVAFRRDLTILPQGLGGHETRIPPVPQQRDLYPAAGDEDGADRLLVERVETIIAKEQQLFWQSQAKAGARQEPPKPPEPVA